MEANALSFPFFLGFLPFLLLATLGVKPVFTLPFCEALCKMRCEMKGKDVFQGGEEC